MERLLQIIAIWLTGWKKAGPENKANAPLPPQNSTDEEYEVDDDQLEIIDDKYIDEMFLGGWRLGHHDGDMF